MNHNHTTTTRNYVKLSLRADQPLDDDESVPRPRRVTDAAEADAPTAPGHVYMTTWIWTFDSESARAAVEALGHAQRKRQALRKQHPQIPAGAYQIATFHPSHLRGVPALHVPRKRRARAGAGVANDVVVTLTPAGEAALDAVLSAESASL
jgi:hypothetical protein